MCLWCEVEERVYDAYRERERKALETIRTVQEERVEESAEGEENADHRHCIWEKKLDYVTARMLRERLAVEMADAELCSGDKESGGATAPRHFPAPAVPAHLLSAFERYIETLFDRLRKVDRAAQASSRRRRKLLPFPSPADPPF